MTNDNDVSGEHQAKTAPGSSSSSSSSPPTNTCAAESKPNGFNNYGLSPDRITCINDALARYREKVKSINYAQLEIVVRKAELLPPGEKQTKLIQKYTGGHLPPGYEEPKDVLEAFDTLASQGSCKLDGITTLEDIWSKEKQRHRAESEADAMVYRDLYWETLEELLNKWKEDDYELDEPIQVDPELKFLLSSVSQITGPGLELSDIDGVGTRDSFLYERSLEYAFDMFYGFIEPWELEWSVENLNDFGGYLDYSPGSDPANKDWETAVFWCVSKPDCSPGLYAHYCREDKDHPWAWKYSVASSYETWDVYNDILVVLERFATRNFENLNAQIAEVTEMQFHHRL